jgi:DNA primase
VLAILSCHLNQYRINLLTEHFDTIYISLDNDDKINMKGEHVNPGQEAARKLIEKFVDYDTYNIVLPRGKDPDECSKDEFDLCFKKSKNYF